MASSNGRAQPRIAIVGGGPAGLVLLLTLHFRGIPATLYEREEGFSSRAHLGGTLDLGWDSGQRALRENALQEQFDKNSRADGDEYRLCDGRGNVLLFRDGDYTKDRTKLRPEIDRSTLRKILLDAVPADLIKWGHALKTVKSLGGGQHQLTFTNGTTVVCDILVGADGANSHVRPLVSSTVPIYHGVNGAEISLAPSTTSRLDMADIRGLVGNGSLFCVEKHQLLAGQLNSDGRIRTYVWFHAPADWVLPRDPDAGRKLLLERYTGWDPRLLKLIEHCDAEAMYTRPLYYLPVGHKWDHVHGVTLIGDAAHVMSPFAGAGANLAMLDGLELGLVLAESINKGKAVDERETAVAHWEGKMLTRAEDLAVISKKNFETFLYSEDPHSAVPATMAWIAGDRNEAEQSVAS